jgi:hypothetical protein
VRLRSLSFKKVPSFEEVSRENDEKVKSRPQKGCEAHDQNPDKCLFAVQLLIKEAVDEHSHPENEEEQNGIIKRF